MRWQRAVILFLSLFPSLPASWSIHTPLNPYLASACRQHEVRALTVATMSVLWEFDVRLAYSRIFTRLFARFAGREERRRVFQASHAPHTNKREKSGEVCSKHVYGHGAYVCMCVGAKNTHDVMHFILHAPPSLTTSEPFKEKRSWLLFCTQELFLERFIGLLSENQRATFAGSMASAWLSLRLQVRYDLMPICMVGWGADFT